MRRFVLVAVTTALIVMPFGVGAQDNKSKTPPKAAAQTAPKSNPAVPAGAAKASTAPTKEPTASTISADEQAIRKDGETYAKAFNNKDAKAIAELYTVNAEYIDEQGAIIQGRAEIEESLKSFFAANPDCKLQLNILSVRLIGPNVAVEDGTTVIQVSKTTDPYITRYSAVHSKDAGKWLVASVRDYSLPQPDQHRTRMRQFEWMQGEWIHEGGDAVIHFNCKPIDGGNFLVRDFTIQIGGRDAISGSQRIGWDTQAGKFKSWVFDSDGGFSEGYWHQDDDTWVLKSSGVTAVGQSASSTSVYKLENPHTMTFQSVDHEVAGIEFPDSPKVKIVRKSPRPE